MLKALNKKVETLDYAHANGFVITPKASRGYTITHPELDGVVMHADNYAYALERMQGVEWNDGGNPEAIAAAGKSVAKIQGEFDDLVARADGGIAPNTEQTRAMMASWAARHIDRAAYHGSETVAKRLKLDDLPAVKDVMPRTNVYNMRMPDGMPDARPFSVTVRFKGGERKTFPFLTRDEAFNMAGTQLTNERVKSIKLEPMK